MLITGFFFNSFFAMHSVFGIRPIISNISIQIYRYRIAYLKLLTNISVPNQQHLELIKAFERRDAQKAREVSGEHIEDQALEILKSIREF